MIINAFLAVTGRSESQIHSDGGDRQHISKGREFARSGESSLGKICALKPSNCPICVSFHEIIMKVVYMALIARTILFQAF